ncbi:hypothetical protein JJB09_08305 [Rhizobium sp. KVB221]|uniref:Tetratricopeptide repeat protein n=1 Tax=Rhizobium setariae TaxID=2801340 RepID=A0A936YKP4_9HYPH|nr:hypothetical protein [Rhizobium setariae]MBL0372028.1 hypothetical protein [Rhizobium setariae]
MTGPIVKRLSVTAVATAAALAFSLSAFAAGGGGGGGGSGGGGGNSGGGGSGGDTPTKTTQQCKNGKVWKESKKKCITPTKASFNDKELYDAGEEFAYAGQYENAITTLKLVSNQNDPRVLNYLGYSNRKAGRMDLGMNYYAKALSIDPDFILARSYMGQALLLQGDVEGAKVQLVEIRDRGGQGTYAYQALYDSLKRIKSY